MRDAICAVYAFMRHADDLSDDESISIEERQVRMAARLDDWHQATQGEATADPVFIALAHAQTCFNIPTRLLDQLGEGVAMDLHREKHSGRPEQSSDCDVYDTFDELYQYCYLVASVVGLVCIRIFGYIDGPRREAGRRNWHRLSANQYSPRWSADGSIFHWRTCTITVSPYLISRNWPAHSG
jgi:phytoene synthase